jgi:hypothetical protein
MDKGNHRFISHLSPGAQRLVLDIRQDPALEQQRQVLLSRRDSAILGCMLEIGVSVLSMALYDIRRSWLIPALNTTLTALSAIGLHGAMTLSIKKIQIHGIITTGLIIACCLNFIAEAMFAETGAVSDTLPAWVVLMALLVPYSLNLGCSSMSLLLSNALTEFLQMEERASGVLSAEQIEHQAQEIQLSGENVCCVCMDKRKDAVCVPCGHKAMCLECAEMLKARERRCPVCRQEIGSIVRVFE